MDTDQLTEMAYDCLRIAEDTSHYITIGLGVLSHDNKKEDEYLKGALKWVQGIKRHPGEFVGYWGL
jgi:hypothetical protein